jgi:hypothetical protein
MSFAIPTMSSYITPITTASSSASTLLLHFDGSNGGSIVDSSTNNVAITLNTYTGTPGLSTSAAKFGTASFANAGGGGGLGYITFPNTLFNFGSSDFTIDFWWNPQTEPNNTTGVIPMHLLNSNFDSTNQMVVPGISMRRNSRLSNNIMLIMSQDGTTTPVSGIYHADGIFETPPLATPWQHIALERYGSQLTFYVNGSGQSVSGALTGNIYYNAGNPFAFGGAYANYTASGNISQAYYDEFRIIKSSMYKGANFTPPTSAYTS